MSTTGELERVRQYVAEGKLPEAAAVCLGVLRREPANIPAIALYGDIAMDMHQQAEATLIFQKLLEIEPRHAIAHERLAALCEQTGDYPAARHHAQLAIELNPRSVMAQTVIANILLSERREEEALEAFDQARSLSPGNPGIENAYVDALLSTGQFSKASEVLAVLIETHPNDVSLIGRLASTREWQQDDPQAEIIRGLLGGDGELRAEIAREPAKAREAYMALFKLASDIGKIDEAYGFLFKCKELRKQAFPFDAARQRAAFANLKELYDENFINSRSGLGSQADDPIFVVGMPRSGTTLLERVISSSPNIVAAGELIIAQRLQEEVCAHFGENQYDTEALTKVPADIWKQLGDDYVARAWRRVPQARHFVDKMPDNYKHLGFIKLMLPRARIVHISRHPVANCVSIFEQDFAGGHHYNDDLSTLAQTYLLYRDLMDHWRGLFGEDIVEVSYEDLVQDTPGAVQRLNSELDLDIDTDLLEKARGTGEIRTASRWQARQGIHTGSIERWRKLGKRLQPLLDGLAPILDESDLR